MLWINEQAADSGRTVRVLAAGAAGDYARPAAEHYAGANVEVITLLEAERRRLTPGAVDFYLATTRYGLDRHFPAPVVHTIGRRGAIFAVVRSFRSDSRSDAALPSTPPPAPRD